MLWMCAMFQEVMRGQYAYGAWKDRADEFICSVLPKWVSPSSSVGRTGGGLLYFDGNINMQYVASSTYLLTVYAKYMSTYKKSITCAGRKVTAGQLYAEARKQTDYILGANPRGLSYMIGFGRNPIRVHHRAASLPTMSNYRGAIQCKQGYDWFNSWNPNPNQATGAIIGGPDGNDNINDNRGNYAQMEPTTYTNAPMVGVLAALGAGKQYW